ncbi:hypothetical protein NIES4102_02350 [Chondrocystis sp. NIES-4102]|nr:hypothetical protein NIES4102_02350 [Chondrocystis sp. NIES-4102]
MLTKNLKFQPVTSKLKYISLWATLMGSLISCQTPLISIKQISESKIGKTVYITGKVVHLAPFIDNTAYQIEDNTAKIWVVTTQSAPKLDHTISIKGKIAYQSLPFAEQELGDFYIIELEQLDTLVNDQQSSAK